MQITHYMVLVFFLISVVPALSASDFPTFSNNPPDILVEENNTAFDNDGDGWMEDDGDCNDLDPAINPSASERCADKVDNNCDGEIDESCNPNEVSVLSHLKTQYETEISITAPAAWDQTGSRFAVSAEDPASIYLDQYYVRSEDQALERTPLLQFEKTNGDILWDVSFATNGYAIAFLRNYVIGEDNLRGNELYVFSWPSWYSIAQSVIDYGWSSTGDRLFFIQQEDMSDPHSQRSIWNASPDGSEVNHLMDCIASCSNLLAAQNGSGLFYLSPDESSVGNKLLFFAPFIPSALEEGNLELDSTQVLRITDEANQVNDHTNLLISSDGQWLAYQIEGASDATVQNDRVFVLAIAEASDLEGAEAQARPLTASASAKDLSSLSPSSDTLYYSWYDTASQWTAGAIPVLSSEAVNGDLAGSLAFTHGAQEADVSPARSAQGYYSVLRVDTSGTSESQDIVLLLAEEASAGDETVTETTEAPSDDNADDAPDDANDTPEETSPSSETPPEPETDVSQEESSGEPLENPEVENPEDGSPTEDASANQPEPPLTSDAPSSPTPEEEAKQDPSTPAGGNSNGGCSLQPMGE